MLGRLSIRASTLPKYMSFMEQFSAPPNIAISCFTAGACSITLLLQVTRIALRYLKFITVNDNRTHLFLYTPLESKPLSISKQERECDPVPQLLYSIRILSPNLL